MLEYVGIASQAAGGAWSTMGLPVGVSDFGYGLSAWLAEPANLAVAGGGFGLIIVTFLWLLKRL